MKKSLLKDLFGKIKTISGEMDKTEELISWAYGLQFFLVITGILGEWLAPYLSQGAVTLAGMFIAIPYALGVLTSLWASAAAIVMHAYKNHRIELYLIVLLALSVGLLNDFIQENNQPAINPYIIQSYIFLTAIFSLRWFYSLWKKYVLSSGD